jgi:hypothetical protein
LLLTHIEAGNLLKFVLVLVYFGLAICAATSSVVVLAAEAEVPWAWWATLFPLAISHATAGLLNSGQIPAPISTL